MSSPVSSAAIPLDALHSATATPTISTVSEALSDRVVAEWTAAVNTPDAPAGKAVFSPLTSRCVVPLPTCARLARPSSAIRAGNNARHPVVREPPRGHAAAIAHDLLAVSLNGAAPAVPADGLDHVGTL